MNAKVSMDRAGRVVLPKPIRDRLQLEPGEFLEVESFDDHIILRAARAPETGVMRKELGVWVYDSGEPMLQASVVRDTIRNIRRERDHRAFGGKS
jgi:AbrB family looped-hinge helix DNA binding protein